MLYLVMWQSDDKHHITGISTILLTPKWENLDANTGMATLPFLDVLIHRSPAGISYSVFRKPLHVHLYIHY